ncbi:TPA: hypothetical protein EYQ19_00080 [Candidatus Pacearchaeota archaeon]|jgi:hypothetical protein|nr:hypothetical protein [Candidatus Pacearchaeota archaeon]
MGLEMKLRKEKMHLRTFNLNNSMNNVILEPLRGAFTGVYRVGSYKYSRPIRKPRKEIRKEILNRSIEAELDWEGIYSDVNKKREILCEEDKSCFKERYRIEEFSDFTIGFIFYNYIRKAKEEEKNKNGFANRKYNS